MHGERLRVGERLDGNVEFGVWGEVATAMAEIGSSQQGGVWKRFLVAFKAVPVGNVSYRSDPHWPT